MAKKGNKIDSYKNRMDSPVGAVLINPNSKKPVRKTTKKRGGK